MILSFRNGLYCCCLLIAVISCEWHVNGGKDYWLLIKEEMELEGGGKLMILTKD